MAILESPQLYSQERFDLEDFNVLLSGFRTDANFYTKLLLAPVSYIVHGFTISQSYIGQTGANINIASSMLLNGDSSTDYSWWVASPSNTSLAIPVGASGLLVGRNYVEIQLSTETGTPLDRAFWNPSANSGQGTEFSNQVDTTSFVTANVFVNQLGFNSGNPDRIPIAIIDLDGSSVIRGIQDRRRLFFRAGVPGDITNTFSWSTRVEPPTSLTFTANASTSFVVGETITFTSGATAKVVTGGLNNITVYNFSTVGYAPGDSVVGGTSGASATLLSYYESFTGADKDIANMRDILLALMSAVKELRGSDFWYNVGVVASLPSLLNYVNAIIAPVSTGASFHWSGTALSITDDKKSGQASSDQIARIAIPGDVGNIYLLRQDGTGGSIPLTIPLDSILFVMLPTAGTSISYSGNGSGAANYQIVSRSSFVPSDKTYWLAYNSNGTVIINGTGELAAGESEHIGDQTPKELLAFIGSPSETSTTPPYTVTPSGDLSNQFGTTDSLTQAISINAANINDMAKTLLRPYRELMTVVSGAPANSNQITGPVLSGTLITLPLDSRQSSVQKQYTVGRGGVFVLLNGQWLMQTNGWDESGTPGSLSSQIMINTDLVVGDVLEFVIVNPQFIGAAGTAQPFFVNYITGQNGTGIPVGALYNLGTNKLQVFRNGLAMVDSLVTGTVEEQYQEQNANNIVIQQAAAPEEVFVMVNNDVIPSYVVLQTGLTSSILTVPTYVTGNGSLQVYRNGVLMSLNIGATADAKYTETSTTSITLALAASTSDVFQFFDGTAPIWRVSATGFTGTTLTIPGGHSFVNGTPRLLVFRNGLLMYNSTSLGVAVDQYQQLGTTQITLGSAASSGELFEFIYV